MSLDALLNLYGPPHPDDLSDAVNKNYDPRDEA